MIFAHRGASGRAFQNTMAAFRLAVELGSPGIELDVHLTKDDEVVIIHDDLLNRTTNSHGLVRDHTLEELKQLDAGGWFDEKYRGEKIPTLEELLAYAADKDQIINIEIKNIPYYHEGIEQKVWHLINRYNMRDRVIVSSFDHYALERLAQMDMGLKLGVLFSTRLVNPWEYANLLPFHVYSLHPHYSFVDEAYIEQSHRIGYKVYAYTIDDKLLGDRQLAFGMDGLFTNYPDHWVTSS